MKAAARKLVDRYIKEWSGDLKCVWEVERPFELHLESVIIIGRADVILDREGGSSPKSTTRRTMKKRSIKLRKTSYGRILRQRELKVSK